MTPQIPFIDLAAQQERIRPQIEAAIAKVLAHGRYILGPEVGELEEALADYCGAQHCITTSSGTDALLMPLMAWGVGPGDAVFVPTFTFVATAEVVALTGATPVLVDVEEDSFNMDPASLEAAIEAISVGSLVPRAVIPVDLFGQPADYEPIAAVAQTHNLQVLADAAQSFGGQYRGRPVGSLGDATATSFFPAKPLGCYGDGGAIFTDDGELAEVLRSLRGHGGGRDKYDNVRVGINGRLDTIQAAILLEKLKIFPGELERRQAVVDVYAAGLPQTIAKPNLRSDVISAWAQYTIRSGERDALLAKCRSAGLPTAIYYPSPLHQQTAYRQYPVVDGGAPVAERHAETVLSLPMHPYLEPEVQAWIISVVREASD